MFSRKATKIDEIFTVDLTLTTLYRHFCGLHRKQELYLVDKNIPSPNKIAILMCNLNATFLFMAVVAKHVKILLFVIYVMALALCCFYDKSVTVAGLHSQTLKGLFALLNLEKNNKLQCSFYNGWRKRQFPLFSFYLGQFYCTMIKGIEILQLQPY